MADVTNSIRISSSQISGLGLPFGSQSYRGVLAARVNFSETSGSAALTSGDKVDLLVLGQGQIVLGVGSRVVVNSNTSASFTVKVSGGTGIEVGDAISASSLGDVAYSATAGYVATSGDKVYLSIASSASGLGGSIVVFVDILNPPTAFVKAKSTNGEN